MVHRTSGFTIIEVSTVLAITGLLAVTVLAGIGRSLGQQRYTDAVNQTIDFFRGQYTSTENIVNDRTNQQPCNASGVVIGASGSGVESQTPGASDCLLVGNLVTSTDGETMHVRQVIALKIVDASSSTLEASNETILNQSELTIGQSLENFSVDWGARLQSPEDAANGLSFALLVVRVPTNGTIVTYVSTSDSLVASSPETLVRSLVAAGNVRQFNACIDPSGSLGVGASPMGVSIEKAAANTTGVQPISSGECRV